MKLKNLFLSAAIATTTIWSSAASAADIQFWHAFTGRLGDLVAEQVETFNKSQDKHKVIASHKGNYSETLNAGIAAFRAKEQPHILMVFEVGTATMMSAKGATKPVYEVMADSGATFDPSAYIGSVKGYYTSTDGKMLSLPFNSSTPVLWVNKDKLKEAGIDPNTDMSTWQKVDGVLGKLKEAGVGCPLTTAWQSWIHLENLSAYHNTPFATKDNGFGGADTELALNGPVQVKHIQTMGDWAKDGKFIYAGRRNEGGANFRAGECALFTESSAGYAGIKAEAKFDFAVLNHAVAAARNDRIDDIRLADELSPEVETLVVPLANAVIIDLRHPFEEERSPLRLPGIEIMKIPFYQLVSRAAELDPQRRYLLYCDQGVMSKLHAAELLRQGLTTVGVYRPDQP